MLALTAIALAILAAVADAIGFEWGAFVFGKLATGILIWGTILLLGFMIFNRLFG
jgi:hypothetical protein